MKSIWIVQHNTGYTSEGFTEGFLKESDARKRYNNLFEEMVAPVLKQNNVTLEEIVSNEELAEEKDIFILENEASFDGPEVYERISIYELEVN